MTKVNIEDLIQFQRGELSQDQFIIVENELKTNKKLRKELEALERADLAIEKHFDNFKMPRDFQLKVKKKFKKNFNPFSFLNTNLILSYSGGIATACFMFAFIYSIDPFLQVQGQRNNEVVYRGNNILDVDNRLMPRDWIVNKDLNFQMVKLSNENNQTVSINPNEALSVGDKILIRIIPSRNMNVSIYVESNSKSTQIKENLILKKGQEVQLPESIVPSQKTFEVEGPNGNETFIIKDKNNQLLFKFKYQIR